MIAIALLEDAAIGYQTSAVYSAAAAHRSMANLTAWRCRNFSAYEREMLLEAAVKCQHRAAFYADQAMKCVAEAQLLKRYGRLMYCRSLLDL